MIDPQRTILIYPDPILRKKAKAITKVTASLRDLVADMFRLMREEEGAGLAAPQVGESIRLFITEARPDEHIPERVFINPVLSKMDGELVPYDEGCLSLPEVRGMIRRPAFVAIDATDLEGNHVHLESGEFPARVWQHEFDHLEGVLIIDRMTPIDRLRTRKAVKDLEREAGK
ncbi:MAG: peptide deformylase [Planctomycetes bacterium]|nr:peptide deformylase [Planctomycetota bacterium]